MPSTQDTETNSNDKKHDQKRESPLESRRQPSDGHLKNDEPDDEAGTQPTGSDSRVG